MSHENQKKYEFNFEQQLIIPKTKKYTFSCWINIASRTLWFRLTFIGVILLIIFIILAVREIQAKKKAQAVYRFLEAKVL